MCSTVQLGGGLDGGGGGGGAGREAAGTADGHLGAHHHRARLHQDPQSYPGCEYEHYYPVDRRSMNALITSLTEVLQYVNMKAVTRTGVDKVNYDMSMNEVVEFIHPRY